MTIEELKAIQYMNMDDFSLWHAETFVTLIPEILALVEAIHNDRKTVEAKGWKVNGPSFDALDAFNAKLASL